MSNLYFGAHEILEKALSHAAIKFDVSFRVRINDTVTRISKARILISTV
jgi:hypothetical protein